MIYHVGDIVRVKPADVHSGKEEYRGTLAKITEVLVGEILVYRIDIDDEDNNWLDTDFQPVSFPNYLLPDHTPVRIMDYSARLSEVFHYAGFLSEMRNYLGMKARVTGMSDSHLYLLDVDEGMFFWPREALTISGTNHDLSILLNKR